MSHAVLHIDGDTTGLRRAFGEVPGYTRRAGAAINAADRQTAASSSKFWAQYERERLNITLRMQAERVRREQAAQREVARAAEKASKAQVAAQAAAAKAAERDQAKATAAAEREAGKRQRIAEREVRDAERSAERAAAARERAEVQATRVAKREADRRLAHERAVAERSTREERVHANRVGHAVLGAGARVVGGAQQVHGMVQDARQTAAQRETELNNALIQTGMDADEARGTRRYIMEQIRRRHLDPGAAIEAIGQAQTFANALGGDTAELRRQGVDQTLADIEFASNIDPTQMGGTVRLGALLRRQVADPNTRSQILRASTGIAFQGSVEAEDTLRGALPGLLRAISTNTANAPAADRDRVIQETTADFLAQIQTVAASGGTVTVSANRIGSLRSALNNEHRQDSLGRALHRRMTARGNTTTPEQLAMFNAAFTRDRRGRYTMNAQYRNSPSEAAALFGTLFNNDATAVANFLGTHGGGGARQLINRPEVGLLTSYFGMTTNNRGQQVRQYEAVKELARSTLTPEREREIRKIRSEEDRVRLLDDQAERERSLTDNTSALNKVSNTIQSWITRNPIGTAVGGTVAGSALPAIGKAIAPTLGRVAGRAGGGLLGLARGAAGGALGWMGRLFSAPVMAAADILTTNSNARGVGAGGAEENQWIERRRRVSLGRRLAQAQGLTGDAMMRAGERSASAMTLEQLTQALRQALEQAHITATMDPATAVHAAQQASTAPGTAPMSR